MVRTTTGAEAHRWFPAQAYPGDLGTLDRAIAERRARVSMNLKCLAPAEHKLACAAQATWIVAMPIAASRADPVAGGIIALWPRREIPHGVLLEAMRTVASALGEALHTVEATGRVVAEATLLRAVVERLPASVLVADPAGALVLANREARRRLGIAAGDPLPALAAAAPSLAPPSPSGGPARPEDLPIARALAGEIVPGAVQRRPEHGAGGGSPGHDAIAAAPLEDASGRPLGAASVTIPLDL
jgi:PAS domain-containing protein